MSSTGMLIVIDGLDGSGKNTQAEMLYNFFKENITDKVIKISFPDYDYHTGKVVREMLTGKFNIGVNEWPFDKSIKKSLFYSFDRMIAMYRKLPEYDNKTIAELYYKEGYVIICDRYTTSNFIHMGVNIRRFDLPSFISQLEGLEYSTMGIIRPDMVITLYLKPEISMKLIDKRGNEKDDHENLNHLKKAYDTMNHILKYIKTDWYNIDCNDEENDFIKDKDVIQREIRRIIQSYTNDKINKLITYDSESAWYRVYKSFEKIKNNEKLNVKPMNKCPQCNHDLNEMVTIDGYYCRHCDNVWIL